MVAQDTKNSGQYSQSEYDTDLVCVLDTRRCCDVESTSLTLIQRRSNVLCPMGIHSSWSVQSLRYTVHHVHVLPYNIVIHQTSVFILIHIGNYLIVNSQTSSWWKSGNGNLWTKSLLVHTDNSIINAHLHCWFQQQNVMLRWIPQSEQISRSDVQHRAAEMFYTTNIQQKWILQDIQCNNQNIWRC